MNNVQNIMNLANNKKKYCKLFNTFKHYSIFLQLLEQPHPPLSILMRLLIFNQNCAKIENDF